MHRSVGTNGMSIASAVLQSWKHNYSGGSIIFPSFAFKLHFKSTNWEKKFYNIFLQLPFSGISSKFKFNEYVTKATPISSSFEQKLLQALVSKN